LREALGMSIEDFSEYLGISDRSLSKWESEGSEKALRSDSQAMLEALIIKASEVKRARILTPFEKETSFIDGRVVARATSGTIVESGFSIKENPSESAAWEVSELLEWLERSDVGPAKMDILSQTVVRLSCDYGREPTHSLHSTIRGWIARVNQSLDRRTTLSEHRELLVCAGWLFLLSGCVEYDMGWSGAAETSRIAAAQIGRETGHGEIQAWAWEMAAWFALTQGRPQDVANYVEAGQRIGGASSVVVQLDAHLARAGARMGDSTLVRNALESGYAKLGRMPRPDNPRNHFIIDPDKWDFYAMDAYRLLGDDARASTHAKEVIRLGKGTNGQELTPMRTAEARLTLGVSAARSGELEEAVSVGESAFDAGRKSLPSLFMVAGELRNVLTARYPREVPTIDYCDRLAELKQVSLPQLEA
jgi:transcriptional regulator with XRE-family HTH domain